MNEVCMSAEAAKYNKWYYNDRFPLLPILRIRQANEYNTWNFSFSWLCFSVWTIDSFRVSMDVGFELDLIQIKFIIPYLVFGVFIRPLPWHLGGLLSRKSKHYRSIYRQPSGKE